MQLGCCSEEKEELSLGGEGVPQAQRGGGRRIEENKSLTEGGDDENQKHGYVVVFHDSYSGWWKVKGFGG
jgi:hypothetical protein